MEKLKYKMEMLIDRVLRAAPELALADCWQKNNRSEWPLTLAEAIT